MGYNDTALGMKKLISDCHDSECRTAIERIEKMKKNRCNSKKESSLMGE
jgi:hypothetical protein